MVVLSSYLLDDANNSRIAEALTAIGGRFIPALPSREERIAQLDEHIHEADILLGGRLSEEQLAKAAKLRWIHVPWAGVNSLLALEPIRSSNLLISNSSGVMSDAVADQAMGCIIMLARDLPAQIRAQQRKEWLEYPVESPKRLRLRGMTLGLLGYGAIGQALAERARGFGMRVIAMRRNTASTPAGLERIFSPEELPELLAISDFVVVTLPLSNDTRGLIGRAELRAMKPTARLINVARGAVIREDDLIDALREGDIAGAALDVFEKEPLPENSPLWDMDTVIITPHSSGGYQGFWDTTVDLFLDNLERFLRGAPLRNQVEPGRGY